MSDTPPRGRLMIGFGAAAGAFAAAAMILATGTPVAHADDLTDLLNVVQGDLADGQTFFDTASTDFASSDVPGGVAALVSGADNDLVSVADNILAGGVALLTNETVPLELSIGLLDPGSFANGLADAEQDISSSQTYLTEAATALSSGDYAAYTFDSLIASDLTSVLASQDLLLGALDSLGI